MSTSEIIIEERLPDVATYQEFKRMVGWSTTSDEAAEVGLKNSLYSVCAMLDGEVVGFGRVVGDGQVYFYLQDIVVHPDHQGKGIGRMITDDIMKYIQEHSPDKSFVGLMAAKDMARFYEQHGFKKRDDDAPGMAMKK